jgi:hypothetical protein
MPHFLGFAQDSGRQRLVDNLAIDYLRIADKQSPLFYGREQEGHLRATNHPYLKDLQYAKARLSYCGVIYPEAMLRLDVSRDELVALSPDNRNIVLFPENVDFAELHGQTIIYFRYDSLPGCPPTGYYTLLHSGNCKVLERQNAALVLKTTSKEQHYVFTTNFYLYKDGVYRTIRTKSGLLRKLQPYKKELKRFISANQLRFRRDTEEFLTRTVGEYEKLSGL